MATKIEAAELLVRQAAEVRKQPIKKLQFNRHGEYLRFRNFCKIH